MMIRRFWHKTAIRNAILWAIIIVGFTLVGLLMDIFSYREGIDFGDGSTFFEFARNISNGEVIYKDFIHFRTPGSYFLYGLMMHLFGQTQSVLNFSLNFESKVLYTAIFLIAIGLFLRFKQPIVGIITGLLIIVLPAYAQLRSGLALLAIVLYIRSYGTPRRAWWLIASGIVAGLSFTFGQDSAIVIAAVIGISELIMTLRPVKRSIIELTKTFALVLFGFVIGVLPLAIYVITRSDVLQFLYYTLYYAFVLQPKAMNLPFPVLSYETIIFYLCFVLYLIFFFIIFHMRKKSWQAIIFLAFIVGRSITLLGRSDLGHLLFIVPELLFFSVYCLTKLRTMSVSKRSLQLFLPLLVVSLIGLFLAINISGLFIIIVMSAILFAMRLRPADYGLIKYTSLQLRSMMTATFCLSATLVLFVYLLYPDIKGTVDNLTTRGLTNTSIEGVNVSSATKLQYDLAKQAIEKHHPQTIFSYPIQAFYYRFAPKHASRFITFELQTTPREENQAIQDLKRTKPGIIVYDPQQAYDLRSSTSDISYYILANYTVEEKINVTKEIWIMVPRS